MTIIVGAFVRTVNILRFVKQIKTGGGDKVMDKEFIVSKAVEYLESMPDGSRTTTYFVLNDIGYGDIHDMEIFDLHFLIYDALEKSGKAEIDMSEHMGKVEGLPQYLDYIVRKKS